MGTLNLLRGLEEMTSHAERSVELSNVLVLLKDFKGEPIAKDEHPLHIAIQALEAKCRESTVPERQDMLFYPASRQWFNMLWASRDGRPNRDVNAPHRYQERCTAPANPTLSMQWRAVLITELSKWGPDYPEHIEGV